MNKIIHKSLVIILLSILFVNKLIGRDIYSNNDSLWLVYKNSHTSQDKISIINQLTNNYLLCEDYANYNNAISTAISLAKKQHSDTIEFNIYKNYFQEEDYFKQDSALYYINRFIALAENNKNPIWSFEASLALAKYYLRIKHNDSALNNAIKAMKFIWHFTKV